ncbi:hypothetical protein J6590_011423 [Homalodisca vitripennis]|nr:hypothetical protein J6590_011423 [Homalodisca vitripennis]
MVEHPSITGPSIISDQLCACRSGDVRGEGPEGPRRRPGGVLGGGNAVAYPSNLLDHLLRCDLIGVPQGTVFGPLLLL